MNYTNENFSNGVIHDIDNNNFEFLSLKDDNGSEDNKIEIVKISKNKSSKILSKDKIDEVLKNNSDLARVILPNDKLRTAIDLSSVTPAYKKFSPYETTPIKNYYSYGDWCESQIKKGFIQEDITSDNKKHHYIYKDRLQKLSLLLKSGLKPKSNRNKKEEI